MRHVLAQGPGEFLVINGPTGDFFACSGDILGVCACLANDLAAPVYIPSGGPSLLHDSFEIENLCGNPQLEVYPSLAESQANVSIYGAPNTIVSTCLLVVGQDTQTCEESEVIEAYWDCFGAIC